MLHKAKGGAEKDMRVLRALRNIFDAFATPLNADAIALADAAAQTDPGGSRWG